MYTDIENFQYVIALLKEYNISHLVISAGNRHSSFVRSVECDDFFKCYSIVDERSAAFFALGLIMELRKPVAICCTSGTSVSNYLSGVSEAYYNSLPLVIISADRNPYYLNQQEEQCVPQVDALKSVCKKSVTLPIIKDDNDRWYCNNLINEALLELNHHGKGPVHINVPVEKKLFDFNTETLPQVRKIDRVMKDNEEMWEQKAKELQKMKRILVSYGQSIPADEKLTKNVELFAKKYNAAIMVDHLSNIDCYGAVYSYNATRVAYSKLVNEMVPDLVICVNGNVVEARGWLINCSGQFKFWNVLEDGHLSDPLRCLDTMFECDCDTFFEKMVQYAPEEDASNQYLQDWNEVEKSIKIPEFEYSDMYTVQQFVEKLPENSLLHLANSNSVRFPMHFEMDKSVKVYCNRGVNGIDGSMSTFVGQAYHHDGLCFLLIGDLSFFYDMNALWNRYAGKNLRIMLNNNSCGEIFYNNKLQDKETVGRHIAADHEASAKAWVESRGFKYLQATTKEEFDENLKIFFDENQEGPIFFEVLTDKYKNMAEFDKLYAANTEVSFKTAVKNKIKSIIGK